ncbi:unnamed protein product [Meganyctiphanes norvegica]|uniref:Uncharacterized protein n=1 Tax=Meganyctiphanes norvegica TaxID=48144 RepID=A0AAV2QV52_MEGNR
MEIEKILAHFGRGCLTMFFVYVRPSMGNIIRNILKMTDQSGVYFDPCSLDESQQLITILPEKFVNVNRDGFRVIYISQASNSTTSQCILHEIDQDEANVILFRSTPEVSLLNLVL